MIDIKDVVKSEVSDFLKTMDGQIHDPAERAALARMANDLALLPIRMAAGEDVTILAKSIKAETLLRGDAFSLKTQAAAQKVWMNVLTKVLGAIIAGALA